MKKLTVLVVAVVLLFVGCGGGGGSGGPKNPDFEGSKLAAEVDLSNMSGFARGVVGSVEMTVLTDDDIHMRSATRIAGRVLSQSSYAAAMPIPSSEHYDGSCGGTFDILYELLDESNTKVTVQATVTAVGYCEDGSTPDAPETDGHIEDGGMVLVLTETVNGDMESTVEFKDWSDTEPSSGDTTTFDGWYNFEWSVGGDPKHKLNVVVVEAVGLTEEMWWLRNVVLKRNPADGTTWHVSGEVYYGDQGFVWLETITTLRLDDGFEDGMVEMNGVMTKGGLTFNVSPPYKIELWNGAAWVGAECFDDDWEVAVCMP